MPSHGLRGYPDDKEYNVIAHSEPIPMAVFIEAKKETELIPNEEIIQTIRHFFPETWIWNIELSE